MQWRRMQIESRGGEGTRLSITIKSSHAKKPTFAMISVLGGGEGLDPP